MFATLLTLMVNGSGLVVLVRLNRAVTPPVEKTVGTVTEMLVQEPPPRRERPRPREETRQVRAARPQALPVPNLPSMIEAPVLARPDMDLASIVKPAFGSDMEHGAELIMAEEAVDVPPQVSHRVSPRYPPRAEFRGTEGHVVMRLLVNVDGLVERVVVEESVPPGVFDEAATRAVMGWRFTPASFRGRKVPVWARQRLSFRLN